MLIKLSIDQGLQNKIDQLEKYEKAYIEKLFNDYDVASKKKNKDDYHRTSQELAEAIHNLIYGTFSIPPPKKRWIQLIDRLIKRWKKRSGFKMLNEQKVNGLNEEEKQQLNKLTEEYEEVSNLVSNSRRMHGANPEVVKRHHQAIKNLAEFITRHNLNRY